VTTQPAFSGVIPPLVSPLTASGDVDASGLIRLVESLIIQGVSGLFVLGSSGEGPWLTPRQRDDVVRITVETAAGRVPVLAGVLDPGPAAVIESVRRAEAHGANAVVATTPYYFSANHSTQLAFFEAVARAASVPVMLYNIPEMTQNPLEPDTLRQLVTVPGIVGLKDSAGNWDRFTEFLAIRDETPGFSVFQGAERQAARAMLAGADGIVAGLANIIPSVFVEMIDAATSGDTARVQSLATRVDAIWHLHGEGIWLTCLKYAASLLGFGEGYTAGHDATLAPVSKERIAALVAAEIAFDTGIPV
jgi:4-hydroxy-tetrahydrodipicolinate synthase